MMERVYGIDGMHCDGCIQRIEKVLNALPRVDSVKVSLEPPEARLRFKGDLTDKELNDALKKAGDYNLKGFVDTFSESTTGSCFIDKLKVYYPLILIFAFISGGTGLRAYISGDYSAISLSDNFMGGFFAAFSFFKLLNLRGFAEAYSTYDIVAKRFYFYGYLYPFIELILAILYFSGLIPLATNLITLIVMSVSSIGVLIALTKRSQIQCACLGTVFNLPMTKVTLFEDLLMAVMAATMLYAH